MTDHLLLSVLGVPHKSIILYSSNETIASGWMYAASDSGHEYGTLQAGPSQTDEVYALEN